MTTTNIQEFKTTIQEFNTLKQTYNNHIETVIASRSIWPTVRTSIRDIYLIDNHRDKYYEYSDSSTVYRHGSAKQKEVVDEAKRLLKEEQHFTAFERKVLDQLIETNNITFPILQDVYVLYQSYCDDEEVRRIIQNRFPIYSTDVTVEMVDQLVEHLYFLSNYSDRFTEDFHKNYQAHYCYGFHINATSLNYRQQKFLIKLMGIANYWNFNNLVMNMDEHNHQLLILLLDSFLNNPVLSESLVAVNEFQNFRSIENIAYGERPKHEPNFIFENIISDAYKVGPKISKQFKGLGSFCNVIISTEEYYKALNEKVQDVINNDSDLNKSKTVSEYKSYDQFQKIYDEKLSDKNYITAMNYDENIKDMASRNISSYTFVVPINGEVYRLGALFEHKTERG